MKKLYLGFIIILFCSSLFSQEGKKPTLFPSEKALTIWSDDFSNPSNWVLSNTSSPPLNWTITMDPNLIPINSGVYPAGMTTAANGFAIINSEAAGELATQNATVSLINTIDLSAYPDVNLEFQHSFKSEQDTRVVRISGDNGANWTEFIITDSTNSWNETSNNPEITIINISSVAGGQSQVLIEFNYQGAWNWHWAIDDVKISKIDANDLAIQSTYFGIDGLSYHAIPQTQIAPIEFSANIENVGTYNQTNAILTVDVDGGVFTVSSDTVDLMVGATDSISIDSLYTPSWNTGTHTVVSTLVSDSLDSASFNNTLTDSFEITEYLYARDGLNYEGEIGGEDLNVQGNYAFEAGSIFTMVMPSYYTLGVEIVIGNSTPVGTIIYGKIYEVDSLGNYLYVDETNEYTIYSWDIGSTMTLVFFTCPFLDTAKTFLVTVGCYSEFYIGASGYSKPQTSYILYGGAGSAGNQYYTTQTPMVRLNLDYCIGVAENENSSLSLNQNIPNPFNNTTTINYTVKSNATINLTVVDMTGKVVMTVNEGNKAAGDYKITLDASTLAGGIYQYTLSNGETSVTKSMSVVK